MNGVAWYQESFSKDFVYGNIINGGSAGQIHYNGDEPSAMADRNGILYFYNNTEPEVQSLGGFGINNNADDDSFYNQRIFSQNNLFWPLNGTTSNMVISRTQDLWLTSVTNYYQTGSVSITTPTIAGSSQGWSAGCSAGPCQWNLTSPMNTHLYGLNSSQYLFTPTLPISAATYIPIVGSPLINAGTALSGLPAQLPVRYQWNTATGSLTPRTQPLTIGSNDGAASPPTGSILGGSIVLSGGATR